MAYTTCAPSLLTHQPILEQTLQTLHNTDPVSTEKAANLFCDTLDFYLELSTLLDPILSTLVNKTTSLLQNRLNVFLKKTPQATPTDSEKHLILLPSQALYSILKVRRPKNVVPYLPHQVSDWRYLLTALQYAETYCLSWEYWRLRTVLFRCASVAIRVPFPIDTISESSDLNNVVSISQRALSDVEPVADSAASFLARLVARRDATQYRSNLISWAISCLSSKKEKEQTRISALVFLAATFKLGHRDDLTSHAMSILDAVIPRVESAPTNTREALLLMKVIQRVTLVLLPPRLATWRYSRTIKRLRSRSNQNSKIVGHVGDVDIQDSSSGFTEEITNILESVIDALLTGLCHLQYFVRWSSAKGVGRLASRLPRELARDVADSVVELLSDVTEARPDAAWQGACLAIAELARRGLLLPSDEQFSIALSAVERAASFDIRRGANTVGANVRDAACYVVWSIARAYDPKHVAQFAPLISRAMVPLALLDREVNCRRAASAALQECVGRLSEDLFKEGISLITIADYFTLGNRTAAYLSLVPKVAQLNNGEHFGPLLTELWTKKLVHWDNSIRALAAKALANLVTVDKNQMIVNQVIPELVTIAKKEGDMLHRHGAILGLAELIKVVGSAGLKHIAEDIRQIPLFLVEKRVLAGRTGDEIRVACALMIESLAISAQEIFMNSEDAHRDAEKILTFLEAILGCGKEEMYSHATSAYEAMCNHVISPDPEWHKKVTERILDGIAHGSMVELQRGFALAAGACGNSSVENKVAHVLSQELCVNKDVEVRRNSAVSLGRTAYDVMKLQLSEILQALLRGMNDYAIDERGDIGSWVRESSLRSSAKVIEATLTHKSNDEEMTLSQTEELMAIVQAVVEQCCSRINRTRKIAGKTLQDICGSVLSHSGPNQLLILCEKLSICFRFPISIVTNNTNELSNKSNDVDSNDAIKGSNVNNNKEIYDGKRPVSFDQKEDVFPVMRDALGIPEVSVPVIHGLVSAGGIVEYHSSVVYNVLVDYLLDLNDANKVKGEVEKILNLIRDNHERLALPALRIIEILVKKGACSKLGNEYLKEISQVVRGSWRGRMRDVQRTRAAVTALTELACLSVTDDAFDFEAGSLGYACIEALCVVLGCTIPRLRRLAAESIYMTLIEFEVDEEELEEPDDLDETTLKAARAVAVLSETEWEQVSLNVAREKRNLICSYLEIQISRPATAAQVPSEG